MCDEYAHFNWSSWKLHNAVITEPQASVNLIFQLIACYGRAGPFHIYSLAG